MKNPNLLLPRLTILLVLFTSVLALRADDPAPTPEDLQREAAIEDFTRKQIAADYGPKFAQAAKEFGVPVEILMSVSFAETRHEHLMWPEGEKFSPENGMPRPYGIMSLWDNDVFGTSLRDGAKLIGRTVEEVMNDPLQNMRAGAALLKKHFDEAPKPEWNSAKRKEGVEDWPLEAWNYAIRKYCGIEDPEFSSQHAFDCYDWLSQGYDQYGIKLPEVPDLDLKEMWEETKKIKTEERAKKEEKWRKEGRMDDAILEEYQDPNTGMWHAREVGKVGQTNISPESLVRPSQPREKAAPAAPVATTQPTSKNWALWVIIIGVCAVILGFLVFRKKPELPKK